MCNNRQTAGWAGTDRQRNYTQMVWQNTTQVGVGVAISASGDIYVVANYAPAGNYIVEYPYQRQ
ncbi:CAP domain-containing protein [Mucilaginibacter psychrotolerans]|nr:CAP domain-containing protein [Mucilaginibacter psychrotolerans]